MWWSVGLSLAALAVVYAYTRWDLWRFRRKLAGDLWRFRRKLAVREAEAERVHQEKMQRLDSAFCDWMDKAVSASDAGVPVTPWVPPR